MVALVVLGVVLVICLAAISLVQGARQTRAVGGPLGRAVLRRAGALFGAFAGALPELVVLAVVLAFRPALV